jgi:hypothetical protein
MVVVKGITPGKEGCHDPHGKGQQQDKGKRYQDAVVQAYLIGRTVDSIGFRRDHGHG